MIKLTKDEVSFLGHVNRTRFTIIYGLLQIKLMLSGVIGKKQIGPFFLMDCL